MRYATLIVKIPGNWIGELCTTCDLSVRVLKCIPVRGSTGQSLVSIEGPEDVTGTSLAERVREIEPSCDIRLTRTGPRKHLATILNSACAVCSVVAETGCFLDMAASQKDGTILWKVIAPDASSLDSLVRKIKELGCEVAVNKVSDRRSGQDLTEVQERVIQLAYDLGYYEIPKKITLDELASRLGFSKSTLNVMLRRAEKKILGERLGARH